MPKVDTAWTVQRDDAPLDRFLVAAVMADLHRDAAWSSAPSMLSDFIVRLISE